MSEDILKNHLERSKLHGAQRIKPPETDDKKWHDKINFTKTEYQLSLLFVIYADFESILRKQDSCEQSLSKSFTTYYQHLCEMQWLAILWTTPKEYGNDAPKQFLDQVWAAATICGLHLASKIPMKQLTQEQWREYNNSKNCSISTKPFKLVDK